MTEIEYTYADARAIVQRYIESAWGDTVGTPYVSPDGYENDVEYLVPWGTRESLVDGDRNFALINNTATFVSKSTGEWMNRLASETLDYVDAMRPIT